MSFVVDNTTYQLYTTELQHIAATLKGMGPFEAVRELRPFDLATIATLSGVTSIGPTGTTSTTSIVSGAYGVTIAPGATAIISFRVQPGFGFAFFGWISDLDLGPSGTLNIIVDSVVRQEVMNRVAYDNPQKKVYLLDQVVFVKQGSQVQIQATNSSAATATGTLWPLAFIGGTKSALQISGTGAG
jgi:hypothetical protein